MMREILFVTVLSIISLFSSAQTVEQATKENNAVVYGSSLKLFFGDNLLITAIDSGGILTNFKVVKTVQDSSRTISLSLTSMNLGGNRSTVLTVKNPFSKTLHYTARMRPKDASGYSETSIMPVLPRISSIEMWPEKLESIILYEFKLADEK